MFRFGTGSESFYRYSGAPAPPLGPRKSRRFRTLGSSPGNPMLTSVPDEVPGGTPPFGEVDDVFAYVKRLVGSVEPAIVFSSLVALCVPGFSDFCTADITEGGRVSYRIAAPARDKERATGESPDDRNATNGRVVRGSHHLRLRPRRVGLVHRRDHPPLARLPARRRGRGPRRADRQPCHPRRSGTSVSTIRCSPESSRRPRASGGRAEVARSRQPRARPDDGPEACRRRARRAHLRSPAGSPDPRRHSRSTPPDS